MDSTCDVREQLCPEDDDEGYLPTVSEDVRNTYRLELDNTLIKTCKSIVFADGPKASAFGKSCLLPGDAQVAGMVHTHLEKDVRECEFYGLRNPKPEPSLFYSLAENILLCICSASLPPEDFNTFVRSVMKVFTNLTTVLVLTAAALPQLTSGIYSEERDPTVMRVISTPGLPGSAKFIQLEQPNILEGVSAGVMTVCVLQGIAAAACIIYSSETSLDVRVIKSYSNFIQALLPTALANFHPQKGLQFGHISPKLGNLYL